MNDPDLTPVAFERIASVLNEHKVKYVIIGGLAALLQGVPLPRTADIDVTPSSDPANKKRLAAALREMEARLRAPGLEEPMEIPLDERTFTGITTMTFVTQFGPFDISFLPDGTTGYEDLIQHAQVLDRAGVKIPVASLEDITRSKRATGREKDAAHITILIEHLRAEQDEVTPSGRST